MSRIAGVFKKLKLKGEAALIPFVTMGDPDLDVTEALVMEMEKRGADIIELGFPFSDPLADGPVIQAASNRALARGITPDDAVKLIGRIRRKSDIPLVFMGYYNPILQFGIEGFAKAFAGAGLDGTIIPDLPMEEAGDWHAVSRRCGIDNILLVAPTTPPERARKIAALSRGFVYYVSVAGITGVRNELPEGLVEGIETVKSMTPTPLAVGFGVSRPDQAAMLARHADGVIVGSAIVKLLERNLVGKGPVFKAGAGLVKNVGEFVGAVKKAMTPDKR
ncbi:MAG: tryptophan synthase subunit alpha [Desulfobacteraceae bacterium]|nr:tryptophan synthase subunit alpha [Desulfobacteraceae bacterium]